MNRNLKILGIASIALSAWMLYNTTDEFLNGPPMYNPRILYIYMLPRWHFFLVDWVCFSALLLAGTLVFISPKRAFYFYNFFMVSYVFSWVRDLPGELSLETILNGVLPILCAVGLYFFRKPGILKEFDHEKALTAIKYVLMIVVFWILTEVPAMIF